MKRLLIFLNREHVGYLDQNKHGQISLTTQLDQDPAPPISLALPARAEPYKEADVLPFLQGLLPDNEDVRQSLTEQHGVSADDPFSLLQAFGQDCAGAISFIDENESPSSDEESLTEISRTEIGARLRSLKKSPAAWHADGTENWSLAGAEPKFVLRQNGSSWFVPQGKEPSSHIIKPVIAGLESQSLNEHLCLSALSETGIGVGRSSYQDFDGEPAIVIKRYDRIENQRHLLRGHQEDLCQATATLPSNKYENESGPGALTIINVLRKNKADKHSINRFVDSLIVNYLLWAPDAHAKNYSVFLGANFVELAPIHGITSVFPYGRTRKSKAAMLISGEKEFTKIERKHWEAFAHAAALNSEEIVTRVIELAKILPLAMGIAIAKETPQLQDLEMTRKLLENLTSWNNYVTENF